MDENETVGMDSGRGEAQWLSEELAQIRRELAYARQRQEVVEERMAALLEVEVERDRLATLLARQLSHPRLDVIGVGGLRGRLARWLLRPLLQSVGATDPQVALIEDSEFFDAGWYVRTYRDVVEAGERPAVHYLYHGGTEGRAAGPRFDSNFYLTRYPEVRAAGVNPLIHYLQQGRLEGRLTVQPVYGATQLRRPEADQVAE